MHTPCTIHMDHGHETVHMYKSALAADREHIKSVRLQICPITQVPPSLFVLSCYVITKISLKSRSFVDLGDVRTANRRERLWQVLAARPPPE